MNAPLLLLLTYAVCCDPVVSPVTGTSQAPFASPPRGDGSSNGYGQSGGTGPPGSASRSGRDLYAGTDQTGPALWAAAFAREPSLVPAGREGGAGAGMDTDTVHSQAYVRR
jgi:hypothetical protein